jgi:hypothetical protein
MKNKLFIWFLILIAVLIYFPMEVYAFKDLTRKEAENLLLAAYPVSKSPIPIYLYFQTGKFASTYSSPVTQSEEKMYTKLKELDFLDFRKGEGDVGVLDRYEVKVREERKNELIEVQKEELEKFKVEGGRWYKTKIFSTKFIGCSGVRNFKEKSEAFADFEHECVDQTKTFTTIAEVLKEIGGRGLAYSNCLKINLRGDWLGEILKDPKTKITYQATFELYDDGWRLRKAPTR